MRFCDALSISVRRLSPANYYCLMITHDRPADTSQRGEVDSSDRATVRRPLMGRLLGVAITSAIALGIAIRAFHILSADFPLNDGGLFYTMIEELERAHYHLPTFTAYNIAGIPYAYPPFGFYVSALVDQLTPLTLIDVFRLIPLVLSSLVMVAFFLLARSLLGMNWALVGALVAFALQPSGFAWLLMGGGVTRCWGFLFVLLSLHQAHRLYTTENSWFIITTGLCVGLTALSHMASLLFLAFSQLLFLITYGRHRRGLLSALLVGMVAIVVASPWVATVVATHGWTPFIAAKAAGQSIFSSDAEMRRSVVAGLARFGVGSAMGGSTGEPLFPLIGVLALLGVLRSLSPPRLLLPLWWLLILLFEPRTAYHPAVPVAMLAGIGMTEVLLPVLVRPSGGSHAPAFARRDIGDETIRPPAMRPAAIQWKLSIVIGLFLTYSIGSALVKDPSLPSSVRYLVALSPEERSAMQWVTETTPETSRFLVVPENAWSGWYIDKTTEWFPALTGRVSLATVQGYEWMPENAFVRRKKRFVQLVQCVSSTADCLEDWAQQQGEAFTHIYIPQPPYPQKDAWLLCCRLLIQSLKANPRYLVLYEKPGAVIISRRPD